VEETIEECFSEFHFLVKEMPTTYKRNSDERLRCKQEDLKGPQIP
jgi:hypothetical protein